MSKGKKYYVVWKGHIPGVYDSWDKAKEQVECFEKALYKGFESLPAANKAFVETPEKYLKTKTPKNLQQQFFESEAPIWNSIAVDAACNVTSGDMEYQGVYLKNRKLIFRQGPFPKGTNNVGEFLALVHALAYCQKNQLSIPVYSDSTTAIIWVKQKKAKTKLFKSKENIFLFDLIERAENWLLNNNYSNIILKWNTQNWGENPADFGRK